ncbi:MAG: selenocysteine lyase/cysteine desulfurase [Crocinitomix sp.]|jgi:selenocysteine lyase/cysteine desulfurase
MKLTCQKELFSLDPAIHYINCAYMAPLLKSVETAGIEGLLAKRNPQTLDGSSFFETLPKLRSAIAQLIHATEPNQIAIVAAASYGLSTAAQNIPCSAGQNVIVVKDEFPSNYYVWERLCKEKGMNLISIAPDENATDRTANWNEKIIAAINDKTAIVAIENTHWMDGTLFNLAAISERLQQVDGYFIVDGTQSVGILDIDVTALKIDALVCAGYKWLMGPYSIGMAYYSERLLNGKPLEENWITRERSDQFASLTDYTDQYRPGAVRYDVGETSNFILVPMFLTAINQLLDWGVNNMHDYVTRLSMPMLETFKEKGLVVKNEKAFSSHLCSIQMPSSINTAELSAAFAANNVFASVRGTGLRISPNVYNTTEDLDLLEGLILEALKK